MKIKLTKEGFNNGLKKLLDEYDIYSPAVFKGKGAFSDTDCIKYKKVDCIDDMELYKKSDFSAKEVFFPITQVLFQFSQDKFEEVNMPNKKTLIFLRACDINGTNMLDKIFLANGSCPDYYYKKLRDNVKFAVIGCKKSFRNCFCVSMGCNKTDNYALGIDLDKDNVYLHIKDDDLKVFDGEDYDFDVPFVDENDFSINLPEVKKLKLSKIAGHPLWDEYNERCIACGRCNFVCPTCSCFTTQDIFYKENEDIGERRRVWASCHINNYTTMAGGHEFRKTKAARMRFKVLHKVYDFKKRFGINMCSGCGRCDDICPQFISFSNNVDKLAEVVNEKECE